MLSVDLNDNMIVQFGINEFLTKSSEILPVAIASVLFLILVLLTWTIQAIQNGFDIGLIPAFGSNMSVSIPNILFNFSECSRATIKWNENANDEKKRLPIRSHLLWMSW